MKRFLLWFHGMHTIGWLIMLPISFLVGLSESISFLNFISIWALVLGSGANWQAARAEMEASDDEE